MIFTAFGRVSAVFSIHSWTSVEGCVKGYLLRMNGKALILAPSITIREQWIARIEEAFLCEGIQGEDYLSQNLKQPKAITVATYQALHSAMTRFQGIQEDASEDSGTGTDECPAKTETKEVDYSGFDLVGTMKEAGIEVLCLDECHHCEANGGKR